MINIPRRSPHRGWKRHFRFHHKKKREFKKGLVLPDTFSMHQKRWAKRSFYDEHSIEHKIAFLGNPNVGKSSLFNILTGSHQHIGNWPGKTVERKEGHFILSDEYFSLIDLPGIYSLSARSEEEIVTRKFIVEEKPDLVCVIADALRLERTLFIALQALELTENIAIIINM